MKRTTHGRQVTRLAELFACGAVIHGGCYGTVDAPGFSGVFSRGMLSIDTLAVDIEASRGGLFVDFPGGYVEADKHGVWVEAPNVNIDIRRNYSDRHDSDDD